MKAVDQRAHHEVDRDLDQEGPALDLAELLQRQPQGGRVARLARLRREEHDEAQRHQRAPVEEAEAVEVQVEGVGEALLEIPLGLRQAAPGLLGRRRRVLPLLHLPDDQVKRAGIEQPDQRVDVQRVGLGRAERPAVEGQAADRADRPVQAEELSHDLLGNHIHEQVHVDLRNVGVEDDPHDVAEGDPRDGAAGDGDAGAAHPAEHRVHHRPRRVRRAEQHEAEHHRRRAPQEEGAPPSQPAAVAVALRPNERIEADRDDRRLAADKADQGVARPLPAQLQRDQRRRHGFQQLEEKVAPQHPEHHLEQRPLGVGERADAVDFGGRGGGGGGFHGCGAGCWGGRHAAPVGRKSAVRRDRPVSTAQDCYQ